MLPQLLVFALLATGGNATVDAVYPNPVTPGDAGEFVVVTLPEQGASPGITLGDGEENVTLSGVDADGPVLITGNASAAPDFWDLPVYEVDDPLALSNGGERLALRRGGRVIDSLRYHDAPEAELYRNGTWIRPGRTTLPPFGGADIPVTAFVVPDDPTPVRERLARATDRIRLGGYTFTDPAIARELIAAHRRGVDVDVLLEGGPVGGITTAEVDTVDTLRAAGIDVRLMGTSRARYDYHHAKYAVVDDAILVTSENWKPGGIGGRGSRGWAVEIRDEALAADLAAVFRADTAGADTLPWPAAKPDDPEFERPDNGTYPTRFEGRNFTASRVSVLLAPDNAAGEVTTLLRSAEDSIRIQQVSVDPDGELMNETVTAARRGVEVRILLSGAWFVREENVKLAERLRMRADRRNLPIEARVVEPRRRFEYVHNKGVIVDGDTVVVGSLNWNPHSFQENREVAVMIRDEAVAAYFGRAFRADWRGAAWRLPWGVVAIVLGGGIAGVGFAFRIGRFTDDSKSSGFGVPEANAADVEEANGQERGERGM